MGLASYGIPNIEMPLKPSKDGLLFANLPTLENESIFAKLDEANVSQGQSIKSLIICPR